MISLCNVHSPSGAQLFSNCTTLAKDRANFSRAWDTPDSIKFVQDKDQGLKIRDQRSIAHLGQSAAVEVALVLHHAAHLRNYYYYLNNNNIYYYLREFNVSNKNSVSFRID